jgi:hypothetical protein
LLLNGGEVALDFRLPEPLSALTWELWLDSGQPERTGELASGAVRIEGHGLCLLQPAERGERQDRA